MKYLFLLSFLLLYGCDKLGIEGEINRMEEPVYIAAVGSEGNVILRDSTGNIVFIPSTYYVAKSIKNSGFKNGDIFIPKL